MFVPFTLARATLGWTSSTAMTSRAHFLTILESTLVYEQGGISVGELWGRARILLEEQGGTLEKIRSMDAEEAGADNN